MIYNGNDNNDSDTDTLWHLLTTVLFPQIYDAKTEAKAAQETLTFSSLKTQSWNTRQNIAVTQSFRFAKSHCRKGVPFSQLLRTWNKICFTACFNHPQQNNMFPHVPWTTRDNIETTIISQDSRSLMTVEPLNPPQKKKRWDISMWWLSARHAMPFRAKAIRTKSSSSCGSTGPPPRSYPVEIQAGRQVIISS